jgi:hypothetical protein
MQSRKHSKLYSFWHYSFVPGSAEEGGEKDGNIGTPPGLVGEGHLNFKETVLLHEGYSLTEGNAYFLYPYINPP